MTTPIIFPTSWTVTEARAAYFAENGFTTEAYDAPSATATLFGLDVRYPSTPNHRRALRAHDLHHVATGFGSDHLGEGEISAWELGSGLGGLGWYVRAIVLLGVAVGFLFSPARIVRAFRLGRRSSNLFGADADLTAIERLRVGELRAFLGLPPDGLSRERGLHDRAPKLVLKFGP